MNKYQKKVEKRVKKLMWINFRLYSTTIKSHYAYRKWVRKNVFK